MAIDRSIGAFLYPTKNHTTHLKTKEEVIYLRLRRSPVGRGNPPSAYGLFDAVCYAAALGKDFKTGPLYWFSKAVFRCPLPLYSGFPCRTPGTGRSDRADWTTEWECTYCSDAKYRAKEDLHRSRAGNRIQQALLIGWHIVWYACRAPPLWKFWKYRNLKLLEGKYVAME